jgi:phosphoserine phosphatase
MNYKSYPTEYFTKIEAALQRMKLEKARAVAAFDADGTLWDTDLGENFFQYQIDHRLVELPTDPWIHYLEMKKVNGDPRDAYAWLAQINHGVSLEKLREWSAAAYDGVQPKPIFSEQKRLVELLLSYEVEVYVVTASITWAVEPGAKAIGIKPQNVIGVETVVKDGTITTEKILPITYRAGKVDALLKRTGGKLPFLCSGNTIGDFELLTAATEFQLAVSAASRDDKLFKSENELQTLAAEKNWWRHRFI